MIFKQPGGLTCVQSPAPLTYNQLALHDWEWILYQAQNDAQVVNFDLKPARALGFRSGIWGVTYGVSHKPNTEVFLRDGKALGRQAVLLGADDVMVDCEYAAKDTRQGRLLQPIIQGIRAGEWDGPVHLTTLGAPRAPYGPGKNDYAIDIQSFLDTGGGIFSQDYANATESYDPEHGKAYWTSVGCPVDRYNSMIGFHAAEPDQDFPRRRFTGAQWVPLLAKGGITRNLSSFMFEYMTTDDLFALDMLTKLPAPPPPGPYHMQVRIDTHNRHWAWENHPDRANPGPQVGSRIHAARLCVDADDTQWKKAGPVVTKALQDAGIPPK